METYIQLKNKRRLILVSAAPSSPYREQTSTTGEQNAAHLQYGKLYDWHALYICTKICVHQWGVILFGFAQGCLL